MADCVFCERIAALDFDPKAANQFVVSFEPLRPVVPGHLLVVSRSHITNATNDPITAGFAMQKAAELAKVYPASNIITGIGEAAGQSVQHLCVHIVPRAQGDGLALPWSA